MSDNFSSICKIRTTCRRSPSITDVSPRIPRRSGRCATDEILGHNGEINTLQGNLNWMASNEAKMTNAIWGGREQEFRPLCDPAASIPRTDRVANSWLKLAASRRNYDVARSEAFRNHPDLEATVPEVKNFYQYYSGIMEAWDGPAYWSSLTVRKLAAA